MTIHRDTGTKHSGPIPARLMALCKEYHSKAVKWEALERYGKHGYRHCGLSIQVVHDEKDPPTPAKVATALLAMMEEHQKAAGENPTEGYRLDAYNDKGDRLNGDGDFIRFADGQADDLLDMRDKGSWALKALNDTHKRYVELLDKIGPAIGVATEALDALVEVVGETLQVQRDNAEQRLEGEEAERSHERRMKMLDFLMDNVGASKSKSDSPLADLLHDLPPKVKDEIRDGIGTDFWDALVVASENPDRGMRAEQLTALMKRMNADAVIVAKLKKVEKKWQDRFKAVLLTEIKAGV